MSDVALYKVNGFLHSWRSSQLIIGVAPFEGVAEMSFGEKRERKKVMGMNRAGVPLGVTSGSYDCSALTMKVYTKTWTVLMGLLTLKGLGSMGSGSVPIIWKLSEPKSPPLVIMFNGCYLEENKGGGSESPDALTHDLTWLVQSMTQNGNVLYSRGPL